MAKQASLAKSETAKPAPAHHRTEAAPATARPDAENPVATLVAPAPAAEPKRRGRPPGKSNGQGAKRAKAAARADILFMVETAAGSDRYEMRPIRTVAELLDLMDEERKLVATRAWREF